MTVHLGDAIREVLPSARADLERLVRIPSVSADPDAARHVWASAGEVATLLREGLEAPYHTECSFFDRVTRGRKEAIDASCVQAGEKATVFLWGDSHAQALSEGLRSLMQPGERVAQVAIDSPDMLRQLALSDAEIRLARIDPGYATTSTAARADAFTRSWRGAERVVGERADTFAEGMATRVTFDLPFGILKKELDDIVTLTEDELAEGVRLALRATHNLAEGAGAASLMAAVTLRDQLAGKKVVCVMSGGNVDQGTLKKVLA